MNDIVVVGGGTAGWMAAIALASRCPQKKITVIDPSAIGAIGVGESVTGSVQMFVADPMHGLDTSEFFRHADATLKAGIWYKDWQAAGTEYLTPIDSPSDYFQQNYVEGIEDFYALATADNAKLSDVQLFSHLMRTNQTDYIREQDGNISGRLSTMSCQFDALKFAQWVKQHACKRPNIVHIDDTIESFRQDAETGFVTELVLKTGRTVEAEFFVDCTGFRRLLLARAYQPAWIDHSQYLRVDRAIPVPVDYAEGQQIPVYTQATAMPHGWMWQVPTRSRLGRGYVYASRYVDDDQAIADMRARGVDPGDSPRIIRFRPGKFEQQWIGNVCAIGLAGGFAEPLEASTIHLMYVQTMLLSELLLPHYTRQAAKPLADKYNRLISSAYEDYIDFISFHYHTGRCDTDFWRDYQRENAITDRNRQRMELWQHTYPTREDFVPIATQRVFLNTGLVIWMPMLCGLGYLRQASAQTHLALSRNPDLCRANVAKYIQSRNYITSRAVGHNDALSHIVQSSPSS